MVQASTKLHYYGAHGRAQQIRYTLAAGGIAFEDVCPAGFPPTAEEKANWTSIGGNTTTNVPMLEMDGKVYTQSTAVLRVAARKGGLMPTDAEELYQVDKIIADCEDIRSNGYKAIAMFGATPEAQENYMKNVLPLHLGNLNRQLGDKAHFVGDSLTVADTSVFDILFNNALSMVPDSLNDFPNLKKFHDHVAGHDKLKAYLESE